MQRLIIVVAVLFAIAFCGALAKSGSKRRGLLVFSVIDLCGVAGYEIYMSGVWEKRVHAPIRIDTFLFEVPVLLLGVIAGVVGTYRSLTDRKIQSR